MTDELPDFSTYPAWMGASGDVALRETLVTAVNCRHLMVIDWPALDAPWTPLDAAEGWLKRIDRDELAEVIDHTPEPGRSPALRRRIGMEWALEITDAVLAVLSGSEVKGHE